MKYKLFLSDFDGTLARSDNTLSERTKKAIMKYREAGGIFGVCTGRSLSSILPRVKELGLEGLVVCFQGAMIYDTVTEQTIKCTTFPLSDCLEVLNFFEERGLHIQMYTKDEAYSNLDDEWLHTYEKVCGIRLKVETEPFSETVGRKHMEIIKILSISDSTVADRVLKEAQSALGDKYYVTRSSEFLVEILPKSSTKGAAVDFLSDYYQIPRAEIAAIGDQANDCAMVARAGGKFAVANGVEALKRIATVVPSNDEDGVARAILKYALGDEE